MAFFIKARILLHVARKNPLPVLGAAGQFLLLGAGAALFGGGAIFALIKLVTTGDFSDILFIIIGLGVGLLCTLGVTVALPFEYHSQVRRALRPIGTQDHGLVYPYEVFESTLSKDRQLTLF